MVDDWSKNVNKISKQMYPIRKSFSEKDKIVLKKLQLRGQKAHEFIRGMNA